MCPDEKKIHVTLSNGPFIDVNANWPRVGKRLPSEKYLTILYNAFPFEIEEFE